MKRCYKCQTPYLDLSGPKFHEVCEGCESYLHCCQNCRSFDEYAKNKCVERDAEYVSDLNGINHCEFFGFRSSDTSGLKLDEREDRPGMRLRPDWRGVKKNDGVGRRRSGQGGERARRARDALDKLFGASGTKDET